MTELVVETRALTKRFGQKYALRDFTLNIPHGGIHAIVGSNGAGKSTLFRLLLGLQSPTSGECKLLGESSQCLLPATRGLVSYVNEEHTLPTWMTVRRVIHMQKALYPEWNDGVFREVLSQFDIDPKQRVSGLSRGERAGFNLSLALAQTPQLMILDEPTLGMDVVAKKAFMESLLFCVHESQATIIYCSHHMDEIERIAESLIVMEEGRLRHQSSPEDFCDRVSAWVVTGPLESDALPGLLQVKNIEGQTHLTVLDQGEAFAAELRAKGAVSVNQVPVNLEHAVNAFLAKNHRGSGVRSAQGAAAFAGGNS